MQAHKGKDFNSASLAHTWPLMLLKVLLLKVLISTILSTTHAQWASIVLQALDPVGWGWGCHFRNRSLMAEAGEVSINAVYKTELYAVTGQFSL